MSGALCHLLSDLVEELIIGIHLSISGALLKSPVGELILARLQQGVCAVPGGLFLCVGWHCFVCWQALLRTLGQLLEPLDRLFLPGSLGYSSQPGCSAVRVLHPALRITVGHTMGCGWDWIAGACCTAHDQRVIMVSWTEELVQLSGLLF